MGGFTPLAIASSFLLSVIRPQNAITSSHGMPKNQMRLKSASISGYHTLWASPIAMSLHSFFNHNKNSWSYPDSIKSSGNSVSERKSDPSKWNNHGCEQLRHNIRAHNPENCQSFIHLWLKLWKAIISNVIEEIRILNKQMQQNSGSICNKLLFAVYWFEAFSSLITPG